MRPVSALFCLLILILPVAVHGQDSRTGISGFYVPEKNSLNIGFTSFDLHSRLVSREKFTADYGLRLIGAMAGRRGGYFAFGYFSEWLLRPAKRFRPGVNIALLAGGGAAAPDYDGWMAQGTLFALYEFNSGAALRAGLNYAFVSGGVIRGFSPLLGISWKLRTLNGADSLSAPVLAWHAVYGESGLGWYPGKTLGFIGTGAKLNFGRHVSGDVMIHAITNTHGGYMQSLLAGGPDFSQGSFHLSPALVLGMGGGGGAGTKGGGLYGAQLGFWYSGRRFHAGLKYQWVQAWSKEFGYQGLLASFGKTLKSDRSAALRWDLVTKAYIGNQGFGNIGARFTAFEFRKLRLMGSTYWAFTHNRGAYGEGLFEASLGAPAAWPFYLITSFGAGAGSGINNRSASIIYAAGIGFSSPLKRLPFSLEAAYWEGGNIPHWSLAFAYRIGTSSR